MIDFFKNSGIPSALATSSFRKHRNQSKENEKHENRFQNSEIRRYFDMRNGFLFSNHGVKASSVIVRGDKDVVSAETPIPEWQLGGDMLNRGCQKRACMSDGGEAINRAEVAGHVDGDEEEISFPWVKSPYVTLLQSFV